MVVKRYTLLAIVLCLVLAMTLTSGAVTEDVPLTQSEPVVNFDSEGPQAAPLMDEVLEGIIDVFPDDAPGALPIRTAINSANPGDTIVVHAGTYNEDITITKSIKLVSDGVVSINGTIAVHANNVTIGETGKGFKINGQPTAAYAVLLSGEVTGCKIEGNTIAAEHNRFGLVTVGDQSNHLINDNLFKNKLQAYPKALLYIGERPDGEAYDATNVMVSNNEFAGYAEQAVILNGTGSIFSGNTIKTDCWARLMVMVDDATINGNTFVSFEDDICGVYQQFLDESYSYDLEAVRNANTFEQAAYVGGDNEIYYFIQDAVDDADWGEMVYVGGGEYTEQVLVLNERLSLISLDTEDGNPAKIILPEGATAVGQLDLPADVVAKAPELVIPAPQKADYADNEIETGIQLELSRSIDQSVSQVDFQGFPYALTVAASKVTVEGFEIEGMYGIFVFDSNFINNKFDAEDYGAYIENAFTETPGFMSIQFIDNLFTGNKLDGLVVTLTQNVYLYNNVFTDNGLEPVECPRREGTSANGAYLYGCENVNVVDNEFTDNTNLGLYLDSLFDTLRGTDGKLTVSGNVFDDNGLGGLFIYNCHNIVVDDNDSISGNGYYGVNCGYSSNLVLKQNYDISENGGSNDFGTGYGVLLMGVTDVVVTDNKILDNNFNGMLAQGIVVSEDGFFDITENSVCGNGTDGIVVFASAFVDILDNEILENGYNEDEIPGDGISVIYTDSNIDGNLIQGNADAGINLVVSRSTITNNDILENGTGICLDDLSRRFGTTAHYNNIMDNEVYGLEIVEGNNTIRLAGYHHDYDEDNDSEDYGRFSFNYWGDVSGPIDTYQRAFADWHADVTPRYFNQNLLGTANAFKLPIGGDWYKYSVRMYTPWFSSEYDPEVGPRGNEPVIPYAVGKGWNMLSMPKSLSEDYCNWNTIADIGNGLEATKVLHYSNNEWLTIADEVLEFKPLESYYVRMEQVDFIPIVLKVSGAAPSGGFAENHLKAGWNMIAPALENKNADSISNVLASIEQTADGKAGWVNVYHPEFPYKYKDHQQDGFRMTKNDEEIDHKNMTNYAGYWVYVLNDVTLTGDATTLFWNDVKGIYQTLLDEKLNVREILEY